MAQIKFGDVVYLNSFPEIKFTVTDWGDTSKKFIITGYDKNRNEFINLEVREEALTLVDTSK